MERDNTLDGPIGATLEQLISRPLQPLWQSQDVVCCYVIQQTQLFQPVYGERMKTFFVLLVILCCCAKIGGNVFLRQLFLFSEIPKYICLHVFTPNNHNWLIFC